LIAVDSQKYNYNFLYNEGKGSMVFRWFCLTNTSIFNISKNRIGAIVCDASSTLF